MDHRLLVCVALPQPQPVARYRELRGLAAHDISLPARNIAPACARRSASPAARRARPAATATVSGGARRFQAETPAARIASSSWLRDSRTKLNTPPSSTAKGSSFSAEIGKLQKAHADHHRWSAHACPAVWLNRSTTIDRKGEEQECRRTRSPTPVRNCTRQIAVERPRPAHGAGSGSGWPRGAAAASGSKPARSSAAPRPRPEAAPDRAGSRTAELRAARPCAP